MKRSWSETFGNEPPSPSNPFGEQSDGNLDWPASIGSNEESFDTSALFSLDPFSPPQHTIVPAPPLMNMPPEIITEEFTMPNDNNPTTTTTANSAKQLSNSSGPSSTSTNPIPSPLHTPATQLTSQPTPCTIFHVPDVILHIIFSYLTLKDQARASQVCRKWHDEVWKSLQQLNLSSHINPYARINKFREVHAQTLLMKTPSVRSVNFWGCYEITNRTLQMLCLRCQEVRHLNLHLSGVTAESLQVLTQLQHLESLTLISGVRDKDLQFLSKLPNIKMLQLPYSAVTDEGLQMLKPLTRLEELNLAGSAITDAGVLRITHLRSLNVLSLAFTSITNVSVTYIAMAMQQITSFNISSCANISDEALASLEKLTNLNTLGLGYCSGFRDLAKVQELRTKLPLLKNFTFPTELRNPSVPDVLFPRTSVPMPPGVAARPFQT